MENLYNKASLVLTPQMVETGKVYSMKPEDRKGDFTFSRSTAATRVNASGNIEKETQNLLTYSNTFNTWNSINLSLTSGQSGYDGSSDAWLLTKSGGGGRIENSISKSGVHTFSVYAKAGTLNWIRLLILGGGNRARFFDLQNGAIGGSVYSDEIDANIEDVGNGWYRCSITTNVSMTQVRIYPANADGDTGGTSGNIYIQDAQIEQGLVARDYIETTTTAVEGGITDNVPRLDYTDSSCPALLLEPQRTNYFRHSEYFETSDWGAITTTITTNNATSPDGYQNATTLTPTSASTNSGITSYLVTSATAHTMSVYAKVTSGTKSFRFFRYNSTDGSASSPTFTATTTWQRFTWTTTPSVAGSSWYITNAAADTIPFDIFGAQLEEGSYATSYIPTYGSSVTRVLETCSTSSNASTFNSTEGVLYAEAEALANAGVNTKISLNDGTSNNSVVIFYYNLSDYIFFQVYKAGTRILNLSVNNVDKSILHKIAFKYKNSDYSVWIDGVELLTDSLADNIPANTLNKLSFDGGVGAYPFNGKVNAVQVYKEALTDTELAALTTI